MDEFKKEELAEITKKLISMSFVLNSYCEYYEKIEEVGSLIEFSEMIYITSKKLFDLL